MSAPEIRYVTRDYPAQNIIVDGEYAGYVEYDGQGWQAHDVIGGNCGWAVAKSDAGRMVADSFIHGAAPTVVALGSGNNTPTAFGHPAPYYAAFAEMEKKPWAWGLAPIHHGCFENGWRGALRVAAELADATDPILAAQIRELGVYTNEDGTLE